MAHTKNKGSGFWRRSISVARSTRIHISPPLHAVRKVSDLIFVIAADRHSRPVRHDAIPSAWPIINRRFPSEAKSPRPNAALSSEQQVFFSLPRVEVVAAFRNNKKMVSFRSKLLCSELPRARVVKVRRRFGRQMRERKNCHYCVDRKLNMCGTEWWRIWRHRLRDIPRFSTPNRLLTNRHHSLRPPWNKSHIYSCQSHLYCGSKARHTYQL